MPNGPSTLTSPYLQALEPNVRFTSILTTGDALGVKADGSPYRMVGIPDGLGAFDNGNGSITVLMNHELGATAGVVRDHGSTGAFVSRLVIDKATLQVLSIQDLDKSVFLFNATTNAFVQQTTAFGRFCSGDLPDLSAFFNAATGKGTTNRIFMNGEENGSEGRAFAHIVTDTDGVGPDETGRAYELPWLGNMSFENSVSNAYSGDKTIVALTDDSTPGQVYFYIGDKQSTGLSIERAGLTNGKLYGVAVPQIGPNAGAETSATTLGASGASTFTLKEITAAATKTGAQIEADSDAAGVSEFFRPEDSAWDPTHPGWLYFVTTASFTDKSRLWRLEFSDINNPAAGGVIRMLLEGGEGQKMFDNIDVTDDGRVVLQEDIGNQPAIGKIWMYDPGSGQLSLIAQHDPARFTPGAAGFVTQDEESSGVIDVTALLGSGGSQAFLLDVQAHNPIPGELVEGGQLLVMYVDPVRNGGVYADTLSGGAGADTLSASIGGDIVRSGSGADRVDAGQGADTVEGGAGDDRIEGGEGNDLLRGDDGNDRLEGDLGDDSLFGGAGADTLNGGLGLDTLSGGDGADLFVIDSLGAVDRILDFQLGVDKLLAPASRGILSQTVIDADGDGAIDDLLLRMDGGYAIHLINVTSFGNGDWIS